jgi:AraC family transcriptional regulator, regulatory protein of adaptative response / methylated-DNA-[protein]-cysteine methyltransferase
MISFSVKACPVRKFKKFSDGLNCFVGKEKSAFSNRVYGVVKKIPPGKTMSYKAVAVAAGNPKAYRAVGNILNKNRDKNIPCHRVIRTDGKIGGYNLGVNKKVSLLKKEGVKIK